LATLADLEVQKSILSTDLEQLPVGLDLGESVICLSAPEVLSRRFENIQVLPVNLVNLLSRGRRLHIHAPAVLLDCFRKQANLR
jgi:hypothetical protein